MNIEKCYNHQQSKRMLAKEGEQIDVQLMQ
jgi:hypothetical protein